AGLDAAPAQHGDQEARDDGGVEPLLRLHAGGDGEGDGERERDDADDEAGREVPPELGTAVPLAEDGHELRLKRVQRGFGKGRRCRPAVRLYRRSGSAPNEEMAKRTEPLAPAVNGDGSRAALRLQDPIVRVEDDLRVPGNLDHAFPAGHRDAARLAADGDLDGE